MVFGGRRSLLFIAVLIGSAACIQSSKDTAEYINAPVQLTVSAAGANTYQLSFYSDNREGGFAGYGVFTAASVAELETYPDDDISAAAVFCSVQAQIIYATQVTIQVGPAAAGATLCNLTDFTLTPGNYVALRARVERKSEPWSQAAIAQIP